MGQDYPQDYPPPQDSYPPPPLPYPHPGLHQQQPDNGDGNAALILGIIGLVFAGLITGIPAIIFGKRGQRKADAGLATNRGNATAGLVLGWISVAVSILAVAGGALLIAGILFSATVDAENGGGPADPMGGSVTVDPNTGDAGFYQVHSPNGDAVSEVGFRWVADTLGYSDISLNCDDLPGLKRGAATSCTGTGDDNPLDLSVLVVDDQGSLQFTDQGFLGSTN